MEVKLMFLNTVTPEDRATTYLRIRPHLFRIQAETGTDLKTTVQVCMTSLLLLSSADPSLPLMSMVQLHCLEVSRQTGISTKKCATILASAWKYLYPAVQV